MYRVGIITASDKGSRGERVDESGAKIKEVVGEFGYEVKFYKVLRILSESVSDPQNIQIPSSALILPKLAYCSSLLSYRFL